MTLCSGSEQVGSGGRTLMSLATHQYWEWRAMTDKPGWRKTYDSAERAVAPRAESLVRSSEFARLTAAAFGLRRAAGRGVQGATALAWHLLNLPARTDVQRLHMQIGALDRDVRRLSLQLEQSRASRGRSDQQW